MLEIRSNPHLILTHESEEELDKWRRELQKVIQILKEENNINKNLHIQNFDKNMEFLSKHIEFPLQILNRLQTWIQIIPTNWEMENFTNPLHFELTLSLNLQIFIYKIFGSSEYLKHFDILGLNNRLLINGNTCSDSSRIIFFCNPLTFIRNGIFTPIDTIPENTDFVLKFLSLFPEFKIIEFGKYFNVIGSPTEYIFEIENGDFQQHLNYVVNVWNFFFSKKQKSFPDEYISIIEKYSFSNILFSICITTNSVECARISILNPSLDFINEIVVKCNKILDLDSLKLLQTSYFATNVEISKIEFRVWKYTELDIDVSLCYKWQYP